MNLSAKSSYRASMYTTDDNNNTKYFDTLLLIKPY